MRAVTLRLMVVASAAILCMPAPALGERPDPARAETLFRQGRASADALDYPRACVAFAASMRLDPAPGTLLNLADCEEHIGRLATAWHDFLRVESLLPAADERKAIAVERARALRPRVPQLTIRLGPDLPRDTRVFCDDVELEQGSLGLAQALDPGSHVVLVVAVGHESVSTPVVLAEHDAIVAVVSPGAAVASPTPRQAPTYAAVWLTGAAGVLSIGVGTYFGGRALAERSLRDAGCTGSTCSALGRTASDAAQNDARIADIALGVGIVALAMGGVLLLTTGGHDRGGIAWRVSPGGVGGAW
jgi:hypothetical protein